MVENTVTTRREIPQIVFPEELLAKRRLQVLHNYFIWWVETITEEFGINKARDLAIKWGQQKGIHTARLYESYLKKKNIEHNNLFLLMVETTRSSVILAERYEAWVENGKGIFRTTICPTSTMFIELGLGLECCVGQCDAFMHEAWKAMPSVSYQRIKGIDKDGICEWEFSIVTK